MVHVASPETSWTGQRRFSLGRHGLPMRMIGLIALSLVACAGAFGASREPILTIGALIGIVGVTLATRNLTVAVGVLVASFFFEGYLASGNSFLTPAKAIGMLAIAAWVLEWGVGRDTIVDAPQLRWIAVMALWIVASMAVARNDGRAVVVASRYFMFFVLFFLVIQAVRGNRKRAEALVDVAVAAAAVSALIGLVLFLNGSVDRASGPVSDPNDFAFLLASTVPLALCRAAWAPTAARRRIATISLLMLGATILATFSRSSLVGLVAAGVWAIATRRLRLRWGLLGAAVLVVTGLVAYELQPQTVQNAFTQKQHVAETNVDSRLTYWRVALEEWRSSPLVGVGVGNYEVRYLDFELPFDLEKGPSTTHNAYLNVLAEVGLFGLLSFVGFLVISGIRLSRRRKDDPATDALMTAVAAGFVVALVGSMFLTEQFYPPIWFLPALGMGILSSSTRAKAGRQLEPIA